MPQKSAYFTNRTKYCIIYFERNGDIMNASDGMKKQLDLLIRYLISERQKLSGIEIPDNYSDKRTLLRSLVNIRPPEPISEDFLRIQDAFLQNELQTRGVTDANSLPFVKDRICLWRGDITTLRCGAIVNAANSRMLGCFVPCHGCIDNAIHTYAGVQLRAECAQLMNEQGHDELTGCAKLTRAYNLPCRYVIHTVGPIVTGRLTLSHTAQLAACYRSCLQTAEQNGLDSVAFCCISTGEFHFPRDTAAEIAVNTVCDHLKKSKIERVIFNVFKDEDRKIYERLLCK